MARRTRAASEAPRTKSNSRTRAAKTKARVRRKSSTKFPPKPYIEDMDSESDEISVMEQPRSFKSSSFTNYIAHPQYRSSDAYYADTEGAGTRRFSDLYGHGHRFEELSKSTKGYVSPRKSVLNDNNKRKLSDGSAGSSPKRVRFNTAADETKVFEKGSVPSPAWLAPDSFASPALEEVGSDDTSSDLDEKLIESIKLPEDPNRHLLSLLRERPQSMSLSQISGLFHVVQRLTEDFARTWFGRATNEDVSAIIKDMLKFPIHDLELKHTALYLTTMNVLHASTTDGVSHVWLKFFAHPDCRQYLVYAILGEWFTQRIFKDTAFGLSPVAQKKMHEHVDQAYLYYEGFVRAKERSKVVAEFMGVEATESTAHSLNIEAGKLADELLVVLGPMLPWASVADQQGQPRDEFSMMQKHEMRHALIELISHCAALNWSIVRSGEDGTIIRIADRIENGKRFWPTAPMHCINQDMVDMTVDPSAQNAVPVVKMTCWARVEAFVPYGLDMVQMAAVEEEARQEHDLDAVDKLSAEGKSMNKEMFDKEHEKFCWECSDARKAWGVLPMELWPAEHEKRQKTESRMKNEDWREKLNRKQAKQQRKGDSGGDPGDSDPDSARSAGSESDTSSSSSMTDVETQNMKGAKSKSKQDEDGPLRGSWVTYYSCLTPHQVYCEWAKPASDFQQEPKPRTGVENTESIRRHNGLGAIVRRARANLPLLPRSIAQIEDFFVSLWNFYAHNNLKIEWGAFVILIIYGLSKARLFSLTGQVTSAAIHLGLDAATHALAGAQRLTGLVLSAAPLQSLRDQLQLLHANIEGFSVRFLRASGYKWHEFTNAVSNAIPRPNTTEIERAVRKARAEGSYSAQSVFERAGSGWTHMTQDAKQDLAQILTAMTATAVVTASASSPSMATIQPITTTPASVTPLGKRFIDRYWGTLPRQAGPTGEQTIVPSITADPTDLTIANENLQSMQDNLPTPVQSDVHVQLGNLDGTPVVTPTSSATLTSHTTPYVVQSSVQSSTLASITASASKEFGEWWLPDWLGRKPDQTTMQPAAAVTTPAMTTEPASVVVEELSRPHVDERYRSAFDMVNVSRERGTSKINESVAKPTEKASSKISAKTDSLTAARKMLTATPIDVESKIVDKFNEMKRNENGGRRESGSGSETMRTVTIKPPGETLIFELPRQDEAQRQREEWRRKWFNRIPH